MKLKIFFLFIVILQVRMMFILTTIYFSVGSKSNGHFFVLDYFDRCFNENFRKFFQPFEKLCI